MKKFYFLFALLLTLFGVTTAQAQDDEVIVEINHNGGTWTGASSTAYAKEWTSNNKDYEVKINCANNNMSFFDGTNIQFYSALGAAQSYNYTFSLTNPDYYFAEVNFDFYPTKHPNFANGPVTVTIDDVVARSESASDVVHFQWTNEDDNTLTSFTLTVSTDNTDYHCFAATTNFKITLKKRPEIDAAWDTFHNLMNEYTFEEDAFTTDGTPGSYGAEEKAAFFQAWNEGQDLDSWAAEDVTVEILEAMGAKVVAAYEALIASKNMNFELADGYYRVRTGLEYSTGTKYLYAYTGNNLYYSLWASPEEEDATDQIAVLWKITGSGEGYDLESSLYPTLRFKPIADGYLTAGSSRVYQLAEGVTEKMAFDPAITIDGTTYVNIRSAKDEGTDGTYFHQNGHGGGSGENGYVIAWNPTYSYSNGVGASEWCFEPVSEEEAQQIIANYEPIRQQKERAAQYKEMVENATNILEDCKELIQGDGLITNGEQFSSPWTEMREGVGAAGDYGLLIDGDASTYWHSDWSSSVDNHTHYLAVDLGQPSHELVRLTITRRPATNDHITKWGVYASNDPEAEDDAWVKIATVETPYGNNKETINGKPSFELKGYQYLRFYIDATTTGRGYGHVSEFQLYSMTPAETSQYTLIGQPAKDLEQVLFEQSEINADEVTEEEFEKLKTAYDAFMGLYVDPTELRDLIAKIEGITDGIVVGTNPGTWNDANVADELKTAIADAKAYDEAKVYVQAKSQGHIDKLNSLYDAVLAAANAIQEGKWYRIRFGTEEEFAQYEWDMEAGSAVLSEDGSEADEALWGKYIVPATYEENEGIRSVLSIFTEDARLGNYVFLDSDDDIAEKELSQYRFINVGDSAYMIQNRATGLFLKAAGTTGGVTLNVHPTLFDPVTIGYGLTVLAASDLSGNKQNYLHAAKSYNQLVTWDAFTPGSRSGFFIEEVGDITDYTDPGFLMDVQPGAIYAMCYPVDIIVEEGNGQLYTVSKVEGTHVTFAPIEKVEAGRPFVYISGEPEEYNPENPAESVKFHHGYDLAPEAVVGDLFAGTYVQKELGAGYIVTGGAFIATLGVHAGDYPLNKLFTTEKYITNSVNAHGAYIILEEGAAGEVTFSLDGTEDGIVNAIANINRNGKIYTIDGRLVGSGNMNSLRRLGKGIYIFNGTKVVVK